MHNNPNILESLGPENIEKAVSLLLTKLGFKTVSNFVYPFGTDLIAYKKAPEPLELPYKYIVEVVHKPVTDVLISRLQKAKEALTADRAILISISTLNKETEATATRLRIETISGDKVQDLLLFYNIVQREKDAFVISKRVETKYGTVSQIFSPFRLADFLPLLAKQGIPSGFKETMSDLKLESWQVFEDAVYSVFDQVFGYTVDKLGKEVLFQREPEGVVLVTEPERFSFIYECKSSSTMYKMISDHELRYKDYINKKKVEVRHLHNLDLMYFVVFSSGFKGDLEKRIKSIRRETGVQLIFFPASALRYCALNLWEVPRGIKKLFNFKDIFDFEIITEENAKKIVDDFHEKYKERY